MTEKEAIEAYYQRERERIYGEGTTPSGPDNGLAHNFEILNTRNAIRSRNQLPDDEGRIARGDFGNPYYNG